MFTLLFKMMLLPVYIGVWMLLLPIRILLLPFRSLMERCGEAKSELGWWLFLHDLFR